ncbi:MAG: glutamine--fructose-6-phosphate transaminase (isomerizing) [Armatimonadetes bacterium]|nr:glutamine--fructose-6-phosphate transaminase (isomerizing) [Armatimonadota bacterium]
MCGIVGYLGPRSATGVLLDELSRLEYRGYDSAGLAVLDRGRLRVVKTVGKVRALAALVERDPLDVHLGIGHTRWATHGRPSTPNAHPHVSTAGDLAVVHNGIIENHAELRARLTAGGAVFVSETDTEVIAHLLAAKLAGPAAGDVGRALLLAAAELRGAFAVAVVAEAAPDCLYVVRQQSPLVIGLGEGETFIASDIPAVLPYTRSVIVLEDGDVACVRAGSVMLSNLAGESVERPARHIDWDIHAAEKGGYEHFMLKEIEEIPAAVAQTLRGRIDPAGQVVAAELGLSDERLRAVRRLSIVACGTSYYAAMVGKAVIEKLARLPVEVDLASEFRYRSPILSDDQMVIAVSQSGETADTLAALREAKRRGVLTLGVVNVIGSSLSREADANWPTWAGPEICVASTKAYVTQLVALYLLALHLARLNGALDDAGVAEVTTALSTVPALLEQILAEREQIADMGRRYAHWEHFFYLGRGLDAASSLECALKLKEISYKRAEAYAAGELKHGPLALMTPEVLVFGLATQRELVDKTLSNLQEVAARGARVIGVVRAGDNVVTGQVDEVIRVPDADDLLMPFLTVVPAYLFTYYLSAALGREIDQPRNLAKSVTVE